MIHIHARTPDGVPSYEIEDFRAITEAINAEVDDVIINYSTGAIGVPIEKRIEYLRELKPDVAALNMSSMNYAKYSKSRKDFVFKAVFENSFDTIIEFLTAMNELGIRAEHECFDTGHIANLDPLLDMGLLREPLQISCVMGVTGGIRPNARNLAHMAEQVPGGPEGPNNWGVIGISRQQWQLVAAALTLGGNVRVGLEDNFYLPDGEMATLQRRPDRQGAADDRGRRPPAGDRRGGARAARGAQARGGMTTHAAQVSLGGRQGRPARAHRARGRPDDRRLVLAGVGRRRREGRPRGAVRGRPVGVSHALVPRPRPPGAPARDQLRGQRRGRDGRHPLHARSPCGRRWSSSREVDEATLRALHDAAHERCFIANTVSCPVEVERVSALSGREGARPLPAAARRVLLAADGRLRRRRAQGRGHRHGRLRALGAAAPRGRRALRRLGAVPGAQPRQALDPAEPQGGGGPRGAAQAGEGVRRAAGVLPAGRARPPRRGLRAPARGEPGPRVLRDHRATARTGPTATAPATT